MNGFIVKMLTLSAVLLISACSILGETGDRAAEKIGEGVTYYCDTVPEDMRAEFRDKVNEYASPNSVAVNCVDEPAQ